MRKNRTSLSAYKNLKIKYKDDLKTSYVIDQMYLDFLYNQTFPKKSISNDKVESDLPF